MKRRCTWLLYCPLAAVILLPTTQTVLGQSGVFSGMVKDSATLAPMSRLRVFLLDDRSQVLDSTLTDERGIFVIPHTEAGIYRLRFERLGMKPVFGPVDSVRADSIVDRQYTAAFVAIPFDSVFYESQVDTPAAVAPGLHGVPQYPRSLLTSVTHGLVALSFVVDTTGHVEMGSVKTIKSSSGPFLKAVMDALPRLEFTPASLDGRKVRQRVEQRFEFKIPIAR